MWPFHPSHFPKGDDIPAKILSISPSTEPLWWAVALLSLRRRDDCCCSRCPDGLREKLFHHNEVSGQHELASRSCCRMQPPETIICWTYFVLFQDKAKAPSSLAASAQLSYLISKHPYPSVRRQKCHSKFWKVIPRQTAFPEGQDKGQKANYEKVVQMSWYVWEQQLLWKAADQC